MTKLIIGLLSILFFSCGGNQKLNETNIKPEDSVVQETILLTLSEQPNDFMEALISGVLLFDIEGCLRLGEYTIVWPSGFRLDQNNEVIYDNEGNLVAQIGSQMEISGGECADCSIEHIKELTGSIPADKCHGSYWIAGEEIRIK